MNKERLQKIADVLRSPKAYPKDMGFDMDREFSTYAKGWRGTKRRECGTVGCIAGFAMVMFAPAKAAWGATVNAGPLLGLNKKTARALFYPHVLGDDFNWGKITPAQAAETIEKLIATGKVDWSHVAPPSQ